jgi:hypothetical protein
MPFWKSTNVKSLLCSLGFLSLAYTSFSQDNSPYSRFALGNLRPSENVAFKGMAGVCLADDNPLIANPSNPATYAGLKMTSYQVAVDATLLTIKNSLTSYRTGGATLTYVNIGFPVSKKTGMSFGLMPQTRSKYSLSEIKDLGFTTATNSYYGGGGLQRIYAGIGHKIGWLSGGINLGYTFGNLVNTTESSFTDSNKLLSNNITGRTTYNGLFWQAGLAFTYDIKKDHSFKAGISYSGNQSLRANNETYWQSFIGNVNDPSYVAKIDSNSNVKGTAKLPATLGMGIQYRSGDYWQIGLDVLRSAWSTFTRYNNADSTGNYMSIRLGGAITPDVNSVTNYWKKMTYRAGIYTGQDIFQFGNQAIRANGITIGVGYPVRRTNLSIGQINASFDVGQRGTTANGLLSERYSKFSVGFTFNDKWFIKRRYD